MIGLLLVVATLLAPSAGADWSTLAPQVNRSIVLVSAADGSCTGFVVNTGVTDDHRTVDYVLTAAHCDGEKLYADHEPATVRWKDAKRDLLLLEVKDTGRPALRFAGSNPKVGEELASYGFGAGLERPMFRIAHVSDDSARVPDDDGGPFIMIDAAFVPGQSGGPVVNSAGQVVMIVQMGSDRLGLGIGADAITHAAGRFFEKPPHP